MPQVNLSTLNGRELRQLLDASRRRGDATLSYEILQEMAARRDGSVERHSFRARRQAEPRLVAVDLGEPMEKDDLPPMPNWRPPSERAGDEAPADDAAEPVVDESVSADAPETPEPVAMSRPLSLTVDDPAPHRGASEDFDLRLQTPPPKQRPPPRGVSLRVFAGFTIGIALGTAFGWWAGGVARDVLPEPTPVQTAALAPAPAPVPPPAPSVAEPPPEAQAATTAEPPTEPVAQPEVQEPVSEPPAPVVRTAEAAKIEKPAEPPAERATPVVAKGCAGEPTPADRAICSDPNLERLQVELRQAYAEALEAHEDRDLLRQHQLAWRDGRNTVSDPDRLARIYEARIRKLNAATAEARGER